MESSTPKSNEKHPFNFDEKDDNDNPEQTGKSASNLTQELLKAGIGEKGESMELEEIDPSILDETITDKVNDNKVEEMTDPKEKPSDWAAESAARPVKLLQFDFDELFNDGLHSVPGKGKRKVKMQKEPEDKTTLPESYPNVWQLARGGATKEECILAVWKYNKERKNKKSREKLKEKVKARKAANTDSKPNPKSSRKHDDTTTVSESSEDWVEVSSRRYERRRHDDKRSYKRGRSPSKAEGTSKRRDTKVTPANKKATIKSTKTEKIAMTDEAILAEYPHMVLVYGSKDKKCPITSDNFSALAIELNQTWLNSKPKVGSPEPSVSGTAFIKDHGVIKCDDAPTAAYYKELLKHSFKAGQFRAWTYDEHDGWTDGSVYVTGKHFPNPLKAFIERALMGRGLQHEIIIKRKHKVELGDVVYLRMKTETANAIKEMPDNTIPAGLTKLQFRFDKPEAAASAAQVK